MNEIAEGVYQIPTNGNCFLIDGDESVTLIDTGMSGQKKIEAALRSIGRSVTDIGSILVTHGHADHFGSAASLKADSGARVVASDVDAPVLQGEMRPPPPPMLGRFGFLATLIPTPDPVIVDHRISGLGVTGASDISVIATPGHTDGHVSYVLDRAGGIVFVGDAAVAGRDGTVKRGFMNRSTPIFDASVRRLSELDFEIGCFGHSGPIIGGAADAFRRFNAAG